jgi:hypothetical protein
MFNVFVTLTLHLRRKERFTFTIICIAYVAIHIIRGNYYRDLVLRNTMRSNRD